MNAPEDSQVRVQFQSVPASAQIFGGRYQDKFESSGKQTLRGATLKSKRYRSKFHETRNP